MQFGRMQNEIILSYLYQVCLCKYNDVNNVLKNIFKL